MAISINENDFEQLQHQFSDPNWGMVQLRSISLFDLLKDHELMELYRLGQIKKVASQAHVVVEGESSRGLFILLHGTVSVYKADKANGNMIRLAFLEAGAAFGELSLFDDAPRSATIVAEAPCVLFNLEEATFNQFMQRQGEGFMLRFYKKCAEEMAQRFRQQNSDYIISQKLLWTYALRKSAEDGQKQD